MKLPLRPVAASLLALAMVAGLAPATVFAADPSPGDQTIQISVGDDAAGGSYLITFERVYSNATVDGTPVYVYVPLGSLTGSAGVLGMDPTIDPNPSDSFEPCADRTVAEYTITQAQVNTLGDSLTNQIVRVDEEHYGEIGLADPADPDSDALVVLAYNAFDDFYYDCAQDSFTAGYFAPDFIDQYGMNVIVTDTFEWADRVGADHPDYEGVIAHELEHLLMEYSDSGELSWVDEGLADIAIFLNGWGDTNDSHLLYHQVFHRETSLTRWGGGLENYGASYTYFLYMWEQAGGNGGGDLAPDLQYDGRNGDRLIKLIFQNQQDGMAGVQAAIEQYNATLQPTETALRSAEDFFKDWAVAIWLDAEKNGTKFDFANIDFGDEITDGWTIEVANELFFAGRGVYNGSMPPARWAHNKNVPAQTALPFGVSYETFRNPGPTFKLNFNGEPKTVIAPHTGTQHWYANYESQNNNLLNVDTAVAPGDTVDFWTWYFIEEGWDYGYVEAEVNGDWVPVPLFNDAGTEVTVDTNPHGNNTEQNGLTGTSGGAYFVDEPEYIHLTSGPLPAGTTDVRFRYSTDAAYLDTGWFVDDVSIDGTAATLSSEAGNWFLTNGEQINHWVIQIVSPCDLTPGTNSAGEIVDAAGFVYRFEGNSISQTGFNTSCLRSTKDRFALVVSNLPTGDLTVLDADYSFTLTNTGNKRK